MQKTERPHVCIVSPALAAANNGNWQTAARWARFLRARCRVTVVQQWQPDSSRPAPDLLTALHARRSADSLAAFHLAHPDCPTVLVLTGTDLYRDIHADAAAQASLRQATRLVLLQDAGLAELPAELRARSHVIYQSAPSLRPWTAPRRHADIAMIGHLRDEKDPATFMRAAALVREARARLLHIGGALDAALGELALATQAQTPRYRWLGALPRAQARQRLRRCHAMALCSRMEGGANVIIEAVTSGVPVLASDISGNRGMLGDDYAGYFPAGDAAALARLIDASIADPTFYATLRAQCAARAPLFAPATEQAALLDLVDNLGIFRSTDCNHGY
ncbi:selenoneine biosynthesis selenosugar synthase SenB [Pseudoduganella armeniaca]|uniref:selenoneine biosynthesis selenosugar synthase SenB n=1 Tax=Pseudoduganella armeniaca TaxID=2072590 RepID=UPI001E2A4F18|nr:selenoneine biosynthesis selenosugar synthase SenB [Pseudoduganella armeniaca]